MIELITCLAPVWLVRTVARAVRRRRAIRVTSDESIDWPSGTERKGLRGKGLR